MLQVGRSDIQQAQIDAVVIRADGSRENLGTIAYYHKNPMRRLAWRLRRRFHRR